MSVAIKEQDLHAIVSDLVDDALKIDRPNKEKICNFVVNMVNNGGHKTKAARAAGYGGPKDENGNKRSEEDRNKIAGAEGYRLLKNDGILSLYEKLAKQKFSAQIFCKSLEKEHLIMLAYKAFRYWETEKPHVSHTFFQEVCKLSAFYADEKDDKDAKIANMQEELMEVMDVIRGFERSPRKPESKPGEGSKE